MDQWESYLYQHKFLIDQHKLDLDLDLTFQYMGSFVDFLFMYFCFKQHKTTVPRQKSKEVKHTRYCFLHAITLPPKLYGLIQVFIKNYVCGGSAHLSLIYSPYTTPGNQPMKHSNTERVWAH